MRHQLLSPRILSKSLIFSGFLLGILLITSSCEIKTAPWGEPGTPMLSFQWEIARPDYINTGTSAIPALFEYGRFYPVTTGWYTMSYGGQFYDSGTYRNYSFQLDYEIWQNPAPQNHSGSVGPNSYLTIVCSPFGPFTQRFNKEMQAAGFRITRESPTVISLEKVSGPYIFRLTYTRTNPDW